jgi:hypothetical protein
LPTPVKVCKQEVYSYSFFFFPAISRLHRPYD